MAKESKRITVERNKFTNYKAVANNFYQGAEVAAEYEYWNAAGVLIVHAAIAYGDAVTIKYGGVKSRGDDHQELVNLLDKIVAHSVQKKNGLNQLSKIIAHKNAVSYMGDIYKRKDITQLKKHIERFKSWVNTLL